MSSSLSTLKHFQTFINIDLEEVNLAKGEQASQYKGIVSSLARSVIQQFTSLDGEEDAASLSTFIRKLDVVNNQYSAEGQGAIFTTSLHALSLLQSLKTKLDPSRQEIIKDQFILELEGLSQSDSIEDMASVALRLTTFQTEVLIPTLKAVQSADELQALEPIVDQCIALKNKLAPIDKKKHLEQLKMEMATLYDLKACQTKPLYKALMSYQQGGVGSLAAPETRVSKAQKLDSITTEFVQNIKNPHVDLKDKVAFYSALSTIYGEFEVHGDGKLITPLLQKLRAALDIPAAIDSSFAIELPALSIAIEFEDKDAVVQKLLQFQQNILIPALQNVTSREELLALEPLVDQCISLKTKILTQENKGSVSALHKEMIGAWNIKMHQTEELYSTLISYKKGQLVGLDNPQLRKEKAEQINAFIDEFIKKSENPAVTLDDKIAIYDALLIIQEEFQAHDDGQQIAPILKKLGAGLGIPEALQSSFPIALDRLLEASPLANQSSVARKLYNFQQNVLILALEAARSPEEIQALKSICEQCVLLTSKLSTVRDFGVLESLRATLIGVLDKKTCLTNPVYSFLITYSKGKIAGLDNLQTRTNAVEQFDKFSIEFLKVAAHPDIPQDIKATIHANLCLIHEEFLEHGDKRIEPILKKICIAVALPFPKPKELVKIPSTSVQSLRSRFETQSTSAPEVVVRKMPVRQQKVLTEEEQRDALLQNIDRRITSLDLGSLTIRDDIRLIKSDIAKLKSLSLMTGTDFAALESILNTLADPRKLVISEEEGRFMELLLVNRGMLKKHMADYTKLQDVTIRNAQSDALKALKAVSGDLEALLSKAAVVDRGVRNRALRARLDRFAELHPFKPALAGNFVTHFPTLVKTFENLTDSSIAELEGKWKRISATYDQSTAGKFSALLSRYSFMDPRKNFDIYLHDAQDHFFSTLNLDEIDGLSTQDLSANLAGKVETSQKFIGRLFAREYAKLFKNEHEWLFANVDNIKKPYNQGDEIHTNLGKGVCYANSIQRYSFILANPLIDSTGIEMGSTEKTRFCQRTYRAHHEMASTGEMTFEDVDSRVYEEFGLKIYHQQPIQPPSGTDLHQHLISEIDRYAKLGYTQCLFSLGGDGGHAVNIQFDLANNIFRIEDDNIGFVEFSTYDEFKLQTESYFKIFYPRMNKLNLVFLDKKI